MRRMHWRGLLGDGRILKNTLRSRGGTWTRIAKAHKAVHPQCAACGTIVCLQTDHIVPLHKGGTNEWTNLQSLCKSCHAAKSSSDARYS
jgi:5-methylcytosine-specific restriction endonuclease McrA